MIVEKTERIKVERNIPVPDKALIMVGPFTLWDVDSEKIGVMLERTGEVGIMNKADLVPYIEAFFGLTF